MADNKYADTKCFILSLEGYQEITYGELCNRKEINIAYESKKFIPLHGMLMEVTSDEYRRFYRESRRQKYLRECSAGNGEISFDMLTTDTFNGKDILVDPKEPVDVQVMFHIFIENLKAAFSQLTEDEKELIRALYYEGLTERQYAEMKGIYHSAVHKKKKRILKKMRGIIDN